MSFDRYVKQPAPDTKIWRYMTFAKFVSLLDKQSLFFAQLSALKDKYEGYIDAPPGSDLHATVRQLRNTPNSMYAYFVVSCWSMGYGESDALWKGYVEGSEGVAIRSTVERLKSSLDYSPFVSTFAGAVEYRDPPLPEIEPGPEMVPFEVNCFYKKTAFHAEREYRILGDARDFRLANRLGGVYVGVKDLNTLVEGIFIAPQASTWLLDLAISLARRSAISAEVHPSDLGKDPFA